MHVMHIEELIKPVSGFPEYLPEEEIYKQKLLGIIRNNFELFGFCPFETPAVARIEVLTTKGGIDQKEIYVLGHLLQEQKESRIGKQSKLGLCFDLTVPLARYVACHRNDIIFPFRRYQIQKVWRGERPQAGRFREFYQCDIDVIGRQSLSLSFDAEMPIIIYHIFKEMNVGEFVVHINNNKILKGFLEGLCVPSDEVDALMRELDKIQKIGEEAVKNNLYHMGLGKDNIEKVFTLVNFAGNTGDFLTELTQIDGNELYQQGIDELGEVVKKMDMMGMPRDSFQIDLKIARGLDYYTGTVYETTLKAHPELGSICSGGRYDDLTSYFLPNSTEQFPGVGISIGLDRLFNYLKARDILKIKQATVSPIMIAMQDVKYFENYCKISSWLRKKGIRTEIFLEQKKLKRQLEYADKKGFPFVIIAGEEEFKQDMIKIKDLSIGQEIAFSIRDEENFASMVKRLVDFLPKR